MYELQNINQNIKEKFFDAIQNTKQKKNWYSIVLVSVENTLHELLPEVPRYVTQQYVQQLMRPIYEFKDYNITVRDFIDKNEAIEVYNNTYKELIEECENNNNIVDKNNLILIDYIYELLEYDKVMIIDDERVLLSFMNLSTIYTRYSKAYNKFKKNGQSNNKSEKAINISSNTATGYKNKTKFIHEYLEPYINHPNINSEKEEIQFQLIQEYEKHHHILARTIHSMSNIKGLQEDLISNAIGGLAPWIDSDGEITKKDFYVSWYASVFSFYANFKIPIKKKLELARLSSYVVFPHLKKVKKTIVPNKDSSSKKYTIKDETIIEYQISNNSAKKPVREKSFFEGLRLYDFSDGRFKITKTKDEIELSELYLTTVTKHLNKLS